MIACFFFFSICYLLDMVLQTVVEFFGGTRRLQASSSPQESAFYLCEWYAPKRVTQQNMIDGRYYGIPPFSGTNIFFPMRCWLPEKPIWKSFSIRTTLKGSTGKILEGRNTSQGESNLILEAFNIAKRFFWLSKVRPRKLGGKRCIQPSTLSSNQIHIGLLFFPCLWQETEDICDWLIVAIYDQPKMPIIRQHELYKTVVFCEGKRSALGAVGMVGRLVLEGLSEHLRK